MTRALLGLAMPFAFHAGALARAREDDKLRQDLELLVLTRIGERPMRRAYGGGLHALRQEPNDETLRALAEHELTLAIRASLPELRLVAPLRLSATEAEIVLELDYAGDPGDVVRRVELRLESVGP
jgi:phage baseplate assembly protein W